MKQALIFIFSIVTVAASAQNATSFTGNFTINKSKVDFGGLPEYVLPIGFQVRQNGDTVTITRTTVNDKGSERSFTEKITIGGDTVRTEIPGGLHRVAVAQWNADRKSFTIYSDSRNADHSAGMKLKETWNLLTGGSMLEVDREVVQADGGEYKITGYYDHSTN
jgi:hypothetical protein